MKSRTLQPTKLTEVKPVKVTLDYDSQRMFGKAYRVAKIVNEVLITIGTEKYHVGDYLHEDDANELITEPNVEVTVVPAKD